MNIIFIQPSCFYLVLLKITQLLKVPEKSRHKSYAKKSLQALTSVAQTLRWVCSNKAGSRPLLSVRYLLTQPKMQGQLFWKSDVLWAKCWLPPPAPWLGGQHKSLSIALLYLFVFQLPGLQGGINDVNFCTWRRYLLNKYTLFRIDCLK